MSKALKHMLSGQLQKELASATGCVVLALFTMNHA